MNEIVSVLSVNELAKVVHKSVASIRSDASRNPGALPPMCRLPGNKRILFRLEDVQNWLAKHVQSAQSPSISEGTAIVYPSLPRKRGRPRKTAKQQ